MNVHDYAILPTRRTRELKTKRKTKKQRRLCLVQQKTIPLGKHVDNIGQHLVFIAGQLLNSCWGCHRNTWRWLASEPPSETTAAHNQTFYRGRAACVVSWDLIESQRLPRPDSMAKRWKTSTWPKSTNLWLYQTWDSSSATRNFKKTNWPSETLLRCRPCLDVWPKPAGDKLHGFVHLWHDGWRPRLCRGWDPRTPWHEWIRGDSRNRSQRSQE